MTIGMGLMTGVMWAIAWVMAARLLFDPVDGVAIGLIRGAINGVSVGWLTAWGIQRAKFPQHTINDLLRMICGVHPIICYG